jgi:serine/threonine protein kinase
VTEPPKNEPWRPNHPLIGQVLAAKYQVAAFIREGGMAQVFCGIQDEEPQHVAIKVVHPDLAEDEAIARRFSREAGIAARLVHPNIVRVLEAGEEDDVLYMVMELLFGEDLSAPIKQRGSFSEARAAQVMIGVCDALQFAHDRGVVHRDIKPENIMLCRQPSAPEREVVKVLDFGIAKVLDQRGDAVPTDAPTAIRSVLTRVGALVGTPAYVSPEQGRAETLDHRADLYSAGVVLYEMICGAPPFEGQTALQIVAKHVHEAPPLPSTHCEVNPSLEALVLQILEKEPGARPQSAREIADRLRALLPSLSAAPIERWLSSRAGGGSAPPPSNVAPSLPAASVGVSSRSVTLGEEQRSASSALTPAFPSPRRPQVDFRPDHPLIGRVLQGRFRVASFVREGGMAQVFCGRDEVKGEHVAIKVVHPELAADPSVVARFLREANLAARLDHPSVVRIVHVGQDHDLLYMAMELLFGDDLSAPIKQRGSISEVRAVEIVAHVCDALQAAHSLGIVHRDIKPENIMLCRQPSAPLVEVVKVLDFGIAKILDPKLDAPLPEWAPTGVRSMLTRIGTIVGTPVYMAPEQGLSQPVDHRTDLYAVGVLLYELICGQPPFDGETPLQIIARHVRDSPRPPSEIARIHPTLEALILRLLAKEPDGRPGSAAEVARALRALEPELTSRAEIEAGPIQRWQRRTGRRTGAGVGRAGPPPPAAKTLASPVSMPRVLPPAVEPSPSSSPGSAPAVSQRPSREALKALKMTVPMSRGARSASTPSAAQAEGPLSAAPLSSAPANAAPLSAPPLSAAPRSSQPLAVGPASDGVPPTRAVSEKIGATTTKMPSMTSGLRPPPRVPAARESGVELELQAKVENLVRLQRYLVVGILVALGLIVVLLAVIAIM